MKIRRGAAGGLLPAVLLLAALLVPAAARAEISVVRHAFARGIEAREPVGEAQVFPADVGTLVFFTQVAGVQGGSEVRHVWIYDGREVASIPLAVQGPTWRTWSAKTVLPEHRGDWTVEVRDAAGALLLTAVCRVE